MVDRIPAQKPYDGPSTGIFILSVRRPCEKIFGELNRFPFDEAALRKAGKRTAVLEDAKSSRDRWQSNYQPFNAADFRLEEDSRIGRILMSGAPYTAKELAAMASQMPRKTSRKAA